MVKPMNEQAFQFKTRLNVIYDRIYENPDVFTFMHLADAFIQSDLQYILAIHFIYFLSEWLFMA